MNDLIQLNRVVTSNFGKEALEDGCAVIPMSFFDLARMRLKPLQSTILLNLLAEYEQFGSVCFSDRALASRCGCSPQTIQKHLSRLEKIGLIKFCLIETGAYRGWRRYDITTLLAYLTVLSKKRAEAASPRLMGDAA